MSLEACVFQVRDLQGTVRGTGFAISPSLVITCAHVVNACKAKVGELLSLLFYPERIELKAEILSDGWSLEEDVAFLRLHSSLPSNGIHVNERLGSFGSETQIKRNFTVFGYPNIKSDCQGFWAHGLIEGKIRNNHGGFRLQLKSQEITFGVSGAPVMDDKSGFIVGIVQKTNVPDSTGKFRDLAYALPIEVLCEFSPDKLLINEISSQLSHSVGMVQGLERDLMQREVKYNQPVKESLNRQNDTAIKITTTCRTGKHRKTTFAKAACYNFEIVKRLSDGIPWVTLEENPGNLVPQVNDLISCLTREKQNSRILESETAFLNDLIAKKRLLIVIDGVIEVFVISSDNSLWHNWQTAQNKVWNGWQSLGGWIDQLEVGKNVDGRLEVFARGPDGALWHRWQTAPNNGWSVWQSMGGKIDSPIVVRNDDGRLEVFVIGSDHALWHMWQTAPSNGWSSWQSLGGWIDQLAVGKNADGRLEIFARGSDGALWHNWQTAPSNGWSGWGWMDGQIDSPVVARNADGRLEIFARGPEGDLWHIWQTAPNNGWSEWKPLGGVIDSCQ